MRLNFLSFLSLALLLSSCVSSPERYYFGSYSEAERFYNKGEYAKAIDKYKEYLEESPEGNLAVIAQYYMAKSQDGLGNTDEAKKIYQGIVDEHSDLVWADFSKTQLKEISSRAQSTKA